MIEAFFKSSLLHYFFLMKSNLLHSSEWRGSKIEVVRPAVQLRAAPLPFFIQSCNFFALRWPTWTSIDGIPFIRSVAFIASRSAETGQARKWKVAERHALASAMRRPETKYCHRLASTCEKLYGDAGVWSNTFKVTKSTKRTDEVNRHQWRSYTVTSELACRDNTGG